jgi:hypothetical protein
MPSDGKSSHCLWQGELKNVIMKCGVTALEMIFMQCDAFT